jgi:hypothetical protein
MAQKILCSLALIVLLLADGPPLFGQDSAKVVILSSRVGPIIDQEERAYFRLFQPYTHFERAVILQMPDGRYFARITLRAMPSGVESDTLVEYPEMSLLLIAEKINHLEGLKSGDYSMGTEPATLEIAEGESVPLNVGPAPERKKPVERSVAKSEGPPRIQTLPIGEAAGAPGPEVFPLVGIGIGVSTYSPDLKGIENAFTAIEEYYRNQGHPVGASNRNLSTGPIFTASLDARFSSVVTALLEAGLSAGAVEVRSFSASCIYTLASDPAGSLRPYVGAGISRYRFRLERRYGGYISQYTTLDAIVIEGGKTGANMRVGIEYLPNISAHLHLFATYLLFPTLDATTSYGGKATAKLSSFQIGTRIVLYF